MAFEATYLQAGGAIDYTPSANVAAGEVVVQGNLIGIARTAIAANALGSLAVEGVFDIAKAAATAMNAGDSLYWDAADNVATTDADGGTNKSLGKAVRAAAADDATVRTRLSQ